jgi:hypothetical protein
MSSDINVQSFSGKVNITSNLLVGSSHLFVDTTNNRVGLVTNNPDSGLHVNSNAYVNTDFRVGSDILMNDVAGRITADSFVGNGSGLTSISSDSGSWVNGANSNVHLAVSTNKVGIGTTDPVTPLELVVGTSAAPLTAETTVMQLNSTLDGSSSDHKCYFKFQYVPESNPVNWTDWSGRIQFVTDATNQGYIEFNPPGDEYAIAFGNTGGGSAAGEIMRLLGTGNVGIGTSTPTQILDVGSSLSNPFICRHLSGSLHAADKRDNVSFGRIDGSDFLGMKCRVDTHTAIGYGDYANQTKIGFFTWGSNYANSREVMSILGNGNVGVGKTNPSYNLDVAGNLRVTNGILDTSWCSGSWIQTCTQSPTVTIYSNNGGGPMSAPSHGGGSMGGNRGRFTAKKAGNYLISCCAIHAGRGGADATGSNLLVVFDAVGTNWNLNNVINTYDEIIDLRVAPSVEEAYTFMCQVYMNVGHYFTFRVHSSGYIDNSAKLLCSAALVR